MWGNQLSTKSLVHASWHQFIRNEDGAAKIEAVILLASVVLACIFVINDLGMVVSDRFNQLATGMESFSDDTPQLSNPSGSGAQLHEQHLHVSLQNTRLVLAGFLLVGVVVLIVRRGRANAKPSPAESEDGNDNMSSTPSTMLERKRQQILSFFLRNTQTVFATEIEVRHLMTDHPSIISPNASRDEVRRVFDETNVRHLLVCEKGNRLLGIISNRDCHSHVGETAADLMTRALFTVSPRSALSPALTQMLNRQISCLPVLEDGRLCGIITTADVVIGLQCVLQMLQRIGTVPKEIECTDVELECTLQMLRQFAGETARKPGLRETMLMAAERESDK